MLFCNNHVQWGWYNIASSVPLIGVVCACLFRNVYISFLLSPKPHRRRVAHACEKSVKKNKYTVRFKFLLLVALKKTFAAACQGREKV